MELLEEEIEKLEARLNTQKEEQMQTQSSIQNEELIKQDTIRQIEEIDKQNEGLNAEIKEFSKTNQEKQTYIDNLNLDITNLTISVSSFDESKNSIEEIVARINLELEANEKNVESKKNLCVKIAQEKQDLIKKIDEANNGIEKAKQTEIEDKDKLEKLKLIRTEKSSKQSQVEKQLDEGQERISNLKDQMSKLDLKKSKMEVELEQIINRMWEDYEITPNGALEYKKPENIANTTKQVNSLRNEIRNLGSVNVDSIEEYKQTKERYDFMCEQRLDLEDSSSKLRKVIQEMTGTMKAQFAKKFSIINKNFGKVFTALFDGGKAEIKLTDEDNILECGIEIEAQPPGKKLQSMSLLSGGEKALTAIALLFAILEINPSPFCVLDEIEAALDDVNVYRFADYLKNFTDTTQFLVITHRKGTMEAADTVYGITMEENGISKLLSMKLK